MPAKSASTPRLAAAAVVGTLVLTSCTGTDPSSEPPPRPRPTAPTSADVPAPDPRDGVTTRAVGGTPLETPERPNLLMITADDAALKDMEFMPHVQELIADEGLTLTQGYAPTPICVPARASLLTGQYAHNHGAVTINGEGGGFPAFDDEQDDDTLPVWLSDAGYDTMFLGKYLNGYDEEAASEYEPPGWTEWRPTLDPTTYNFADPAILVDGVPTRPGTYSTTLLNEQTQELLSDPARQSAPWYLWVNYVAPHVGGPREPDDPPKVKTPAVEDRDRDTFADLDNSDTPNMFEDDVTDKQIVRGTQKRWSAGLRDQVRELRQQRVESLQSVDRAVRDTIDTLRRTGQLDNTYIVFNSDNGFGTGEHNIVGKLWYFTDLMQVPTLIRGPGLPRGETSSVPVTQVDWAPTFAGLAGVREGDQVDGVDVTPYLTSRASRRVIPIEGYPVNGGLEPIYTGIVVGPWVYARGRSGVEELYNRDVDPYQLVNVRKDPRFKTARGKLRRLHERYVDCAADTCPQRFMR